MYPFSLGAFPCPDGRSVDNPIECLAGMGPQPAQSTGCKAGAVLNPITGQCTALAWPPDAVPPAVSCPGGTPSFGGYCWPTAGMPGMPPVPPGFPGGSVLRSGTGCPAGTTDISGYCVPGSLPTTGKLPGGFSGMQNPSPGLSDGLPAGTLLPNPETGECGAGYVSVSGYCVADLTGAAKSVPAGFPVTLPPGFPPEQTTLPAQGECDPGFVAIGGYCVENAVGLPTSGPLPGKFGGMQNIPGGIPQGFPLGTLQPGANGECAPGYRSFNGLCVPDPAGLEQSSKTEQKQGTCGPGEIDTEEDENGQSWCAYCLDPHELPARTADGYQCFCVEGWVRDPKDPQGACVLPQTGEKKIEPTMVQCYDGSTRPAGQCPSPAKKTSGEEGKESKPQEKEKDDTLKYALIGGGVLLAGGLLLFGMNRE